MPPSSRGDRAAPAEIPNPKGCRLSSGPNGREHMKCPNLWRSETVDFSTERTKGPTQPVMDAKVGQGYVHIYRASMRGKSFGGQRYDNRESMWTSPLYRLRA